jgi:Mn2+/Fe2+ NRAMP family transporter
MPTYSFKEDISPLERYKLTLHLMLSFRYVKRLLIISMVPFLLIVILNVLLGDFSSNLGSLLIFPGILLFVFIVLPLLLVYILPNKKNVEIVVSSTGVVRRGDNFYFEKPWSFFDSWDENKNFIFIYFKQSKMAAHIIKKSWFKSEEEMMEFLSFVDSSLS